MEVDVVVVGGGPAGEVVVGRLGERGVSAALVEERLVGGECSYYACMPSKALLRPIELAAEVGRVPGLSLGPLDLPAVLARRDEAMSHLDDGRQETWLAERGVALVRGRGRLAGERRVRAGDVELRARRAVVIATGSTAALPPIPGLREAGLWTNREGTTSSSVPARLAVLGGGPVGVELATAWAGLGAAVTLVHRGERLLEREEPFAGKQVEAGLRDRGVDVRLGVEIERVERNGAVRLVLRGGETVEADEGLAALGRTPATGDLGLETVGARPGRGGFLEVDDRLRVGGRDWLYAVGDVNGRALLTHMGKYQARLCADAILGRDVRVRADGPRSPRVTFSEPQVGAVGLTLAAALEEGLPVRAVDVETSGNAGGSFVGRGAAGTARLVVDEERSVVVGATFTGAEIAEALHAATIAVVAEVPLDTLWHAVPAFPTRSELWLKLLEALGM